MPYDDEEKRKYTKETRIKVILTKNMISLMLMKMVQNKKMVIILGLL